MGAGTLHGDRADHGDDGQQGDHDELDDHGDQDDQHVQGVPPRLSGKKRVGWLRILSHSHFRRFDLEAISYLFCICLIFSHKSSPTLYLSPGPHRLEIATWKPSGSLTDSLSQHFLGGAHQLKSSELIFSR